MDNRSIDIKSEGDAALRKALEIIWDNAPGGHATHYMITNVTHQVRYWGDRLRGREPNLEGGEEGQPQMFVHHSEEDVAGKDGDPTLILLWSHEGIAVPLPYPLDLEGAYGLVTGWLRQVEYGSEPGHDGSNGRGWRLFTDGWGHVAGHHYGIVGVQPLWAMYGK